MKQLDKLAEIAANLQKSRHALALVGVGSVGNQRYRLDNYSDIDFFTVVEDDYKQAFIHELWWLGDLVYSFRNTIDGYKALTKDGLFCEFAVFGETEYQQVYNAHSKIIWQRKTLISGQEPARPPLDTPNFHLNESLTNLYVGLLRLKRGERLNAYRVISQDAVGEYLNFLKEELPHDANQDPYVCSRRFEQNHPEWIKTVYSLSLGIEQTEELATRLFNLLIRESINPEMAAKVQALL
ncbi:hypothetical protein [Lactobacillus corticis]|uniref:Aminoglycoside 6-adenylyltransferase n=1 Tax=Lactobacillus corticis TaxID=2201249 RepID=A0A916QJH8_9LACO|nr:hypothetical protein [Lactobacillus corticis]GFZ26425.1 hypothetical protein LCB40_03050 [Lactobacillus corticis]